MPRRKSNPNPTTPSRRSPRKKSLKVPGPTQTKTVSSRKSQNTPIHSPAPSSEVAIEANSLDNPEINHSSAQSEPTGASGDELDELDGSEVDKVDEIDELDELESSVFNKVDPKAPAHESEESVLEISDDALPLGDDPEVDQFFDDAVLATTHKSARGGKPIPKSLKLKVKPQRAPTSTAKTGLDQACEQKVRKTLPDFASEIDVSDLLVPSIIKSRVHLSDATRPFKFARDASFWDFKYQIADAFELPTKDLRLAYTTNETKRERRLMAVEEDFASMINDITDHFERHITAIRNERLKDAIAAHNAKDKGRIHAPKARQNIPDIGLIFYHQPLAEDTSTKGTGSKGKGKDSGVKGLKQDSVSTRTQQARDEIVRNLCKTCGVPCVIIPCPNAEPEHKPLQPEHIDLWSNLVAQSLCTVHQPPAALVMKLAKEPSTRKRQRSEEPAATSIKKPYTVGSAAPQPPNPGPDPNYYGPTHPPMGLSPYQHPPPSMPLSYYPSPYYAPPGPFSHPTYIPAPHAGMMIPGTFPPNPYQPAYPTYHQPPPYYPQKSWNRRVSPYLSDWLPSLDHGERGRYGDQFSLLVSGFASVHIIRLSHLRDYDPLDLTRISFFMPDGSSHHLGLETARRLMMYVQEDQPLIDPVDEEKRGAQPKAGPSGSN